MNTRSPSVLFMNAGANTEFAAKPPVKGRARTNVPDPCESAVDPETRAHATFAASVEDEFATIGDAKGRALFKLGFGPTEFATIPVLKALVTFSNGGVKTESADALDPRAQLIAAAAATEESAERAASNETAGTRTSELRVVLWSTQLLLSAYQITAP